MENILNCSNFLWKNYIPAVYKPQYEQSYIHDWLTEWVKHIKREHESTKNILYWKSKLYNLFLDDIRKTKKTFVSEFVSEFVR